LKGREQNALAVLVITVLAASLTFHDESRLTSLTATSILTQHENPCAFKKPTHGYIEEALRDHTVGLPLSPKLSHPYQNGHYRH
jgi:hypothetical protein